MKRVGLAVERLRSEVRELGDEGSVVADAVKTKAVDDLMATDFAEKI